MIGRSLLSVTFLVAAAAAATAQQPVPVLDVKLVPANDVSRSAPAQYALTVQSASPLPKSRITFRGMAGLIVVPASADIPAGQTRFELTGRISRDERGKPSVGEHRLTAELMSLEAAQPIHIQQSVTVQYRDWITVPTYLSLGLVGVALGYIIRFFINVLKTIPQPNPAPTTSAGPITQWVEKHYYQVDFMVTLCIAFIILVGLIKNARPPDTGATWYAALALGTGLGVLTNSDLLTRLR